jgi:hypothetical protein
MSDMSLQAYLPQASTSLICDEAVEMTSETDAIEVPYSSMSPGERTNHVPKRPRQPDTPARADPQHQELPPTVNPPQPATSSFTSAVDSFLRKLGITASTDTINGRDHIMTEEERNHIIEEHVAFEMKTLSDTLEAARHMDIAASKLHDHIVNGTFPTYLRQTISIGNILPMDSHLNDNLQARVQALFDECRAKIVNVIYSAVDMHRKTLVAKAESFTVEEDIVRAFWTSDGSVLHGTTQGYQAKVMAYYHQQRTDCLRAKAESFAMRDAKYQKRVQAKIAKKEGKTNNGTQVEPSLPTEPAVSSVNQQTTHSASNAPLTEAQIVKLVKDTISSSLRTSQNQPKKSSKKKKENDKRHTSSPAPAEGKQQKPKEWKQDSSKNKKEKSSSHSSNQLPTTKRSYLEAVKSNIPGQKNAPGRQGKTADVAPPGSKPQRTASSSSPKSKKPPDFQKGSPLQTKQRNEGGDRGKLNNRA